MAGNDRSYTAGRFALELDGAIAGYVKSCQRRQLKGNVAVHQLGPDNVQKKHLATIECEADHGARSAWA